MTRIQCIKGYFADSARPLENKELRALSPKDREELGELCANAQNVPTEERDWLKQEAIGATAS